MPYLCTYKCYLHISVILFITGRKNIFKDYGNNFIKINITFRYTSKGACFCLLTWILFWTYQFTNLSVKPKNVAKYWVNRDQNKMSILKKVSLLRKIFFRFARKEPILKKRSPSLSSHFVKLHDLFIFPSPCDVKTYSLIQSLKPRSNKRWSLKNLKASCRKKSHSWIFSLRQNSTTSHKTRKTKIFLLLWEVLMCWYHKNIQLRFFLGEI